MMRFAYPGAAEWLVAIPIMWAAFLLHRALRQRLRRLSGLRRDLTLLVLASVAAVSLIFAAARPQVPMRAPEYESVDLLLLLDRSVSMWARDIRPSRARRASLEIRNFLATKPEAISRVGLIGFSGTSLVLSHQTRDPDILLFYLDWMEEDPAPMYGTNLTGALQSALDMAQEDQPERRKFVVLISDGDDRAGSLDEAVSKFVAARIPIYCIGIGSNSEVPIPAGEGALDALLDEQGTPMTTQFNEVTLRRIAGATGGQYYRSIRGEELGLALGEIASRERRIVRWKEDQYRELYTWGLAVAGMALSWGLAIL
jgi:Ca-activated chloride channel family protein